MDWKNRLIQVGVMDEGEYHFVGSPPEVPPEKSMHFSTYISPELLSTTGILDDLSRELASLVDPEVDCMFGLGQNATILGTATALKLNIPFCPSLNSDFQIRNEYRRAMRKKKVAMIGPTILADALTTHAWNAIFGCGGKLVQGIFVWDSRESLASRTPIKSLIQQRHKQWTLENCLEKGPCAKGVAIKRRPGKGRILESVYKQGKLSLPEGIELVFTK